MAAKQFEVKAKDHSAAGGTALNTGVVVAKGDRLIIKAAEDDTWACGELADYTSNANGLVAGNKHGGVYGNMLSPTSGALLPYGSLVGSLDGGKSHFLVGTQYDAPAQQAGTLTLCYWDANSEDNTGSVTVSVEMVPTAVTVKVDPVKNNSGIGVPCNTGVEVKKGDVLKITVPVDQKWINGPDLKPQSAANANGTQQKIKIKGCELPLCSLVGSLDGGKTFFFIGTKFEKPMTESGTLTLYFWDTDANNSGFVTPTISLGKAETLPTAVTVKVDPVKNNSGIGVPCNTGVEVKKGDVLKISVPVDQKWSYIPELSDAYNADGASGKFQVKGFEFPLCSLVGSLDGGKTFFFVGTKFEKTMAESGPLSLYFWDSDGHNNSGFVTPTISLVKAA